MALWSDGYFCNGVVCMTESYPLSLAARAEWFGIRVARTEVLEQNQRFGLAAVLDRDTSGGCPVRDEQFVFGGFAEADHGWRLNLMPADGAVTLRQDQSVRGAVGDGDRAAGKDSQLFGGVVAGAIGDPQFLIAAGLQLGEVMYWFREDPIVCSKLPVHIRLPIKQANQEVEIVGVLLRNILHEQFPADGPPFYQRLEHGEHVAVDLRLIGNERARRVQNARVDLPPRSRLEAVSLRQIQDAVVAFVPAFQASANFIFGRSRLQAHERVREVVVLLVVLRREVVRFRLALLPDQTSVFITLVHVVRDGAEVVEELAED